MSHRNVLSLIPEELAAKSISLSEIVLPVEEALLAISHLESAGHLIAGWEGWIRDSAGRVGHGNAPLGTKDLSYLPVSKAAKICSESIVTESATWSRKFPNTSDELFICVTVTSE